jgi:predicted lipid-binding transport protein (Tim44 family)
MFEIVLWATLAVIVCVVFFSVMGQQVGRGPDEDAKPEDIFGTTKDMDTDRPAKASMAAAPVLSLVEGAELTGADKLKQRDPSFDPRQFLDQATTAYSMVLESFASGDRDTLAMLLTPRMQEIYGGAITDRDAQDLTQVTDVLRVGKPSIEDVRIAGKTSEVDVKFSAELSSALVDRVGQPVQGDPDLVAKVNEVWTFERKIGADDPAWYLADVAPETGDELEADPAPDTKS